MMGISGSTSIESPQQLLQQQQQQQQPQQIDIQQSSIQSSRVPILPSSAASAAAVPNSIPSNTLISRTSRRTPSMVTNTPASLSSMGGNNGGMDSSMGMRYPSSAGQQSPTADNMAYAQQQQQQLITTLPIQNHPSASVPDSAQQRMGTITMPVGMPM
ncbi:hypothetical protein KEM54_003632, partial [Ascosphaera aggregata]